MQSASASDSTQDESGRAFLITISPSQHDFVRRLARHLIRWHVAISAGFVAFGVLLAFLPDLAERVAPVLGPVSRQETLIVALVLTWILVTVVLSVARRPLTTDDLVLLLGTAMLSVLYLIFLRERATFGDMWDYLNAGRAIGLGEPFPSRYVYPPLWAYVLAGFQAGLGERAAEIFCFVINHLSLVAFLPLAVVFLQRCGMSRQRATLLVLVATAINVATVRNVVYVQVNFLVLDLLLLGVLAPRRYWWLAGTALAVGTHIKLLPLIAIPLFVMEKRWRLLVAYGVAMGALFAATALPHGLTYWGDFVQNLGAWQPAPFRAASIPAFLGNTAELFGLPIGGWLVARPLQLALAGAIVWLSWRAGGRRVFTGGTPQPSRVIDGLVPGLFLWPVLSPTLWVHHLVVLIPSALALIPYLGGSRRAAVFAVCWFLVFLSPTVDLYPVSYLRLVGWLGLLYLAAVVIREGRTRAC